MTYILLADGLQNIAAPLTPESLSAAHPTWAEEGALLHWQERDLCGLRIFCADGQSSFPKSDISGYSPRIFICGACSSSLDVARLLYDKGILRVWDSVLGLSQNAGRGQLRRVWDSPAGNVYAAWRLPAHGPYKDEMASLVAGLLLAQGFQSIEIPVKLKWPNDLLINDSKIGGILLEERGDLLLAGTGINIVSHPPESSLRDGWAVAAGALHDCDVRFSAGMLWRTLVKYAVFCYEKQILLMKEEQLTRRVQEHLAWVGREIYVHGGDLDNRPGRILGVNHYGALRILLNASEQEKVHSCEHVIYSGSIIPTARRP